MRFAAIAFAAALATAPAFAQYDPGASRAENTVNSLNRSMQNQEQTRAIQQQNQFENNALRNQISRTPAPIATPGIIPRR